MKYSLEPAVMQRFQAGVLGRWCHCVAAMNVPGNQQVQLNVESAPECSPGFGQVPLDEWQ
jgi:hypothetical protein